MNGAQNTSGQARGVGRDRCEVCDVVIIHRPIPGRRRCADHLNQLVLVPLSAIRTNRSTSGRRDGR